MQILFFFSAALSSPRKDKRENEGECELEIACGKAVSELAIALPIPRNENTETRQTGIFFKNLLNKLGLFMRDNLLVPAAKNHATQSALYVQHKNAATGGHSSTARATLCAIPLQVLFGTRPKLSKIEF